MAGGTVYGCGSRVDGSAKHVVRRRAWRRVDAAAREGMVAPGLGVQEGEGETPNGMVRVAAGLVGEGRDDMLSRLLGAVILTTGVGIDVAAREGMVAPGPGVQEGEDGTASSMVRVAAGLVDEGRGGMLWKLGVNEPGGEDRGRSSDFVS